MSSFRCIINLTVFVILISVQLIQSTGQENDVCVKENNAPRVNATMQPYEANIKLVNVAKAHNDWMVAHNCFHTECMGEAKLGERVKQFDYSYSGISELVSANNKNCSDAVKSWMDSQGRDYILGKYFHIGCAVANCSTCEFKIYYTCVYGKP